MKIVKVIALFALLLMAGVGFINHKNQEAFGTPIPFTVPDGWPKPTYDFTQNPLTKEGFDLGKKLFYDGRLSKDGNFPCASCHQQFGAFSTYDHSLSHGYNNGFTIRNAPALFNLAWQKEFMYDGGVNHLDVQPLVPLTAPNEMHETIDSVILKLKADKEYRRLFKAAFGSELINTQRLTRALSQFLVAIVSNNSLYDKVKRGEASFNLPQRLGYDIFKQKCAACHTEPLFTDLSYRNAGLEVDSFLNDYGRMRITNNPADSLKFRVPSLRNVMVTFPYGHDGRFFSMLSVMNHYKNGATAGPTTDTLVKNMRLSNFEIGQLTAFLYTLTDSALLRDIRFAPPGLNDALTAPLQDIH